MKRNNPSLLVLGGVLTLAVLSACGKGKDATSEVNANCAPSTFSNAGSGGGTPAAAPAASGPGLLLTTQSEFCVGVNGSKVRRSDKQVFDGDKPTNTFENCSISPQENAAQQAAEARQQRYETNAAETAKAGSTTPYDAAGDVRTMATEQRNAAAAAPAPCNGAPATYTPSRITTANQANQNSGIVSPPAKMEKPDSAPAGTSGLPGTVPAAPPTTEGLEKILSTVKAANPPTTSDPVSTTPSAGQTGQDCTGLVGGKIGQNCTTRTGNTGFAGENLGLTEPK